MAGAQSHDGGARLARSGEGDDADRRMPGEGGPGDRSAGGHQIDDAVGHAGLFVDGTHGQGDERGQLGGLPDHGAARCQGCRDLFRSLGDREVPWCDDAGDAERLVLDDEFATGCRVVKQMRPQVPGLLAEPLVEARGILDLGPGLPDRLALFEGDQRGEPPLVGQD